MRGHGFLGGRIWIVLVITAALIAGHGFFLYYFSSHFALSAAVVGVIAVVVIKHVGLLGSLYGLLQRRSRH
jgi:hypothetical protein